MAVFTIQSPDGRKIKIEAADEATAMRGAQEWAAANPASPSEAEAVAPEGLAPGSPQYAQWAAEQARAGKKLPQVSPHTEFQNTAQEKYDSQLELMRRRYHSDLTDDQWQKSVDEPMTNLKPHDAGGLFAEGMRWNLGDEARGAAGAVTNLFNDPGTAFQDYQRFEQSRRDAGREQSGVLGTAAEIGGSILSGGAGATATRPVTAVQAGVDAAKQGAAYGALATEGDLGDRAVGAAVGGGTGFGLGAGANAVGQRMAQGGATKAAVKGAPTAATIKQGAKSAYRQMEATGAVIKQPALNILRHDMKQAMRAEGIIRPSGKVDTSYTRVASALESIDDFAAGPLGMKEAQTLHKSLRRAAGSTDPEEARIGMKMLEQFEDWMDSLPASAVVGKADEAFNAWAKGKSEWARFKKVQTLETAIGKASRAKGGFAAGLKSQFNRILDNPKRQRGFTKTELEAMRRFAEEGTMDKIVGLVTAFKGVPGAAAMFGATGGNLPLAVGAWGAGQGAKAVINQNARGLGNSMRANAALPGGIPKLPLGTSNKAFEDMMRRGQRGVLSQLLADE